MPGLHKMTCSGLVYIQKRFMENPNISFSILKREYNLVAVKRGWEMLKSTGTLRYHLANLQLYKIGSRKKSIHPYFGRTEILMKHGGRRELAKKFHVSEVTVRDALKFRTRSNVANMIRKAALEMGGVLQGAKTLREGLGKESNESLK